MGHSIAFLGDEYVDDGLASAVVLLPRFNCASDVSTAQAQWQMFDDAKFTDNFSYVTGDYKKCIKNKENLYPNCVFLASLIPGSVGLFFKTASSSEQNSMWIDKNTQSIMCQEGSKDLPVSCSTLSDLPSVVGPGGCNLLKSQIRPALNSMMGSGGRWNYPSIFNLCQSFKKILGDATSYCKNFMSGLSLIKVDNPTLVPISQKKAKVDEPTNVSTIPNFTTTPLVDQISKVQALPPTSSSGTQFTIPTLTTVPLIEQVLNTPTDIKSIISSLTPDQNALDLKTSLNSAFLPLSNLTNGQFNSGPEVVTADLLSIGSIKFSFSPSSLYSSVSCPPSVTKCDELDSLHPSFDVAVLPAKDKAGTSLRGVFARLPLLSNPMFPYTIYLEATAKSQNDSLSSNIVKNSFGVQMTINDPSVSNWKDVSLYQFNPLTSSWIKISDVVQPTPNSVTVNGNTVSQNSGYLFSIVGFKKNAGK
ncbi:MAG: hypothetical protein WC797_02095 [Candidatus Paceibacterota bacterium]|jgi:hypothetical protein